MHDDAGQAAAAALLAEIWRDVLRVDHVSLDDDFYSLGGDSLLAIKIVGAAKERGLPLTLLQLFRSPTPRGAVRALAGSPQAARPPGPSPGPAAGEPLSPGYPLPDDAQAAYPATRLQLGMIYESLASDGALYVDVVSRTVLLPLDAAGLRTALDRMARRHPILRTRFDLANPSGPVQVVQAAARLPLTTADHAGLPPEEVTARYETTMAALAEPYDPETAPLMRVHAAATGTGRFRLSYSFHHAIIDGWSDSVFLRELVTTYAAQLRGERAALGTPAPFTEFVRLEQAALRDDSAPRFFAGLLRGAPAPPARHPSREHLRKVSAIVPAGTAEGLARRCAAWGVPMKSLVLAACRRAAAALWDTADPVIGLAVNGRPELAGADLTLGLFLNHLPVRFDASGTWRSAARAALSAERDLLPYRWFPYAEIRNAAGGDPFEVSLNYMRFHARDELLDAGLIGADEDLRDFTGLPARVEIFDDPRGLGLTLHVTVDQARYGADLATRLTEHLRTSLHEISAGEEAPTG